MNTDVKEQLRTLWKSAFPDPDAFLDAFFSVAYSPERCRYLTENGKIVSALYWFDCTQGTRKFAYLYAVATHPDHRGKGLASQLLTQTHALLQTQGYSGAVLKPGKGLFPFYRQLGYETCGFVRRFETQAGAPQTVLRPLAVREYGELRRKLLPENAFLQEGAALELLSCFAAFYTDGDGLVCAFPEESEIIEYLGESRKLPGILAALGMDTARVTVPGGEMPFVMYYPLDSTPAPGYLGLSLE